MRTQGNRIATMREALLCLSTQTSQDFEVCIVGHDLDADRRRAVEGVIADLHDEMRGRVRLVLAAGGTRATPLNVGFADAHGHYIAAFDDDDLLLGHWVETFEQLARCAPGQVLRQVAVAQDWELTTSVESGTDCARRGRDEAAVRDAFRSHRPPRRKPHAAAFGGVPAHALPRTATNTSTKR